MNATEKLKVLSEKNQEIAKLKKEAYEISKDIFEEWCRDFFERNEAVGSFSWNQ